MGFGQDLKNVFKNFKSVSHFGIKAGIAYFKYAHTKKRWKKIGYIGPRPRGKVYDPPEHIIEKKIVMDCPDRPPVKPMGKQPEADDPGNEYQKSPFHNYEFEKKMEANNKLLKEKIKPVNEYTDKEEVDILIIGSGPGGAALAHTLKSKLKDKKIVMLEEGKLFTSDEFTQLETDVSSFYNPRFSDNFSMDITQGRMIGGSAVLNDAICFELPKESSESWDQDVATELKEGGYYEKVQSMINYKRVSDMAISKNARMFRAGIEKLNKMEYYGSFYRNTHGTIDAPPEIPDEPYRNQEHQLSCVGCGFCPMGCKYNRKQSPLVTYIPAAVKMGVDVYQQAKVKKVLYEEKNGKLKVTGVRVKRKGLFRRDLKIKAKIVVSSCGAINSAQLLLKSDVKNPYLGKNISAHPSVPMFALFKDEQIHGDWGIPMCGSYEEFFLPKGNKDIFPDGFGYIIESVYNPPMMTAVTMPKKKMEERMNDYTRMAKIGVLLRGNNLGELKKRHGTFSPLQYNLTGADKTKIRHGIRTAANIFLEAGADEVFTVHFKELLFRKDHKEEDLKKADTCSLEPRDLMLHTAHPQGGCKMGKPGNGVVDFNGHSYDVDNLFVCDASLFPTSIGVNPQVTILALATKIGEHLAAKIDTYI